MFVRSHRTSWPSISDAIHQRTQKYVIIRLRRTGAMVLLGNLVNGLQIYYGWGGYPFRAIRKPSSTRTVHHHVPSHFHTELSRSTAHQPVMDRLRYHVYYVRAGNRRVLTQARPDLWFVFEGGNPYRVHSPSPPFSPCCSVDSNRLSIFSTNNTICLPHKCLTITPCNLCVLISRLHQCYIS